jgi:hypothetical protein
MACSKGLGVGKPQIAPLHYALVGAMGTCGRFFCCSLRPLRPWIRESARSHRLLKLRVLECVFHE